MLTNHLHQLTCEELCLLSADELVKTLGFVMDCKTAWASLLTKDSTYICR